MGPIGALWNIFGFYCKEKSVLFSLRGIQNLNHLSEVLSATFLIFCLFFLAAMW